MTNRQFEEIGKKLEAVFDCCRDEIEESRCKECPYQKYSGDRCWRVMISDMRDWKREAERRVVVAQEMQDKTAEALAYEVMKKVQEDR